MIFDPIYLLFVAVPSLLLAMWAQGKISSAWRSASQMPARAGVSGAEAARLILDSRGLHDVGIEPARGWLSDHYDPAHRVLRLSPPIFGGHSLASLGVAAHEAGHALQQASRYAPLTMRNAIVPFAAIGSNFAFILIVIGLVLHPFALWIGVGLFGLTVLFQLVNLPVEFDASSRARATLGELGLVTASEAPEVKRVLDAAALTYVAAAATAVLNLLYFVMLALGSSRE